MSQLEQGDLESNRLKFETDQILRSSDRMQYPNPGVRMSNIRCIKCAHPSRVDTLHACCDMTFLSETRPSGEFKWKM